MSSAVPESPADRPSPWRWWVCGLLFLATTLNYMDRQALSQMAPVIEKALGMDHEKYSRLETGFSFAFATGAILTGVVVDRVSVRFVYPFMVLGWSLAGVLTGYVTGFWSLLGCRIMLGLFESGNWPCGIRTTRTVLRPEERSFGNAVFQSGTAIGAIVTPFLVLALQTWAESKGISKQESWKLPFRIIGCIGLLWIAFWFLTVPGRLLRSSDVGKRLPTNASSDEAGYFAIFGDRRFWALLIVVTAINISWHSYRAWLPIYLTDVRGQSREAMSKLTTGFYIMADVGSWTIGLLTWILIRRGLGGHAARMLVFAGCAGLALVGIAFPFTPTGWEMTATVLIYAFAALGLFPTYFSLTQEVSARHQGKVTGTLGAGAHLFLSLVMYPIEGRWLKQTNSFEEVFAGAAIFPLLAFIVLVWLWPRRQPPSS